MILGQTIYKRLTKSVGKNITYDFDIRYLSKWIDKYPECFPKFIRENNYKIIFNSEKLRYELFKLK